MSAMGKKGKGKKKSKKDSEPTEPPHDPGWERVSPILFKHKHTQKQQTSASVLLGRCGATHERERERERERDEL